MYKRQVHDTSSSGATLFIEPMSVVEANNDIRVLKAKEKAEIERILQEISAECGAQAGLISSDFETLITLNIYFAKARLAERMNAVMPQITDSGIIRLNKARHPLIDRDKVVPVSLTLGEDYTSLVVKMCIRDRCWKAGAVMDEKNPIIGLWCRMVGNSRLVLSAL